MTLQRQLDQVVADAEHWPAWKRRECDLAPIRQELNRRAAWIEAKIARLEMDMRVSRETMELEFTI